MWINFLTIKKTFYFYSEPINIMIICLQGSSNADTGVSKCKNPAELFARFFFIALLTYLPTYLQCDTYITYTNHDIHGSTPNTLFTLRYITVLNITLEKKVFTEFFLFCLNIAG